MCVASVLSWFENELSTVFVKEEKNRRAASMVALPYPRLIGTEKGDVVMTCGAAVNCTT